MSDMVHRLRFTTSLILGLAVIALGALFMLDNLGVAHAGEALRWWPVLLVAYGLERMVGLRHRPAPMWGALITVVGAWLLLQNLGAVKHDVWVLWPLLLVFLGIGIIRGGARGMLGVYVMGGRRRGRRWRRGVYGTSEHSNLAGTWGVFPGHSAACGPGGFTGQPAPGGPEDSGDQPSGTPGHTAGATGGTPESEAGPGSQAGDDDSSAFRVSAFMSNVFRRVAAQGLRHGEVVAVMGGADIDLRNARMAEGSAELEVDLLLGGVNLFVPEDWSVEFQGTPIMGGVEDQSRRPSGSPRGRLIIHGQVILGGIVIKN